MKQIVIKMRTMKKLFNDNLLQLALILSLLKVRCQALVSWFGHATCLGFTMPAITCRPPLAIDAEAATLST